MNENHEIQKMIKEMWYTIDSQANNVRTIKNCVVFFTVFMIISIVVTVLAYWYSL